MAPKPQLTVYIYFLTIAVFGTPSKLDSTCHMVTTVAGLILVGDPHSMSNLSLSLSLTI